MRTTPHLTFDEMNPLSLLEEGEIEAGGANGAIVQFFVFQGDRYLGWDCFHKERITLGRSGNADFVLNDQSLADIHAIIHRKGDRIIVSDESLAKGGRKGVRVNGQPVKACMLGPLDFVTIGSYTLKIKVVGMVPEGQKLIQDLEESLGTAPGSRLRPMVSGWRPEEESPDSPLPINGNVIELSDGQLKSPLSPFRKEENLSPSGREERLPPPAESESATDAAKELLPAVPDPLITPGPPHFPASILGAEQAAELGSEQAHSEQVHGIQAPSEQALHLPSEEANIQDTLIQIDEAVSLLQEVISPLPAAGPQEEKYLSQQERNNFRIDLSTSEPPHFPAPILDSKQVPVPEQVPLSHDENDEEEDDDSEALFSLREKLIRAQQGDSSYYTSVSAGAGAETGAEVRGEILLEVIKLRESEVIDVCFLHKGEKYYCEGEHGRFCLAEYLDTQAEDKNYKSANDDKEDAGVFSFFFTEQFQGKLIYESNSHENNLHESSSHESSSHESSSHESDSHESDSRESIFEELTHLCLPENLFLSHSPHGEKIYRSRVPLQGTVCLNDDYYEYIIRSVRSAESPQVVLSSRKGELNFHKDLLKSLLIHGLFLLFGGLLFSVPDQSHLSVPLEPRFAEIDTRQLAEEVSKKAMSKVEADSSRLKKAEVKPKPQKVQQQEEKIPKQEEKTLKQKNASIEVNTKQKITRSPKQTSASDKRTSDLKPVSQPLVVGSSHNAGASDAQSGLSPDAGGGSGRAGGNILNRNIKQAGLLGVLGTKDGVDSGAKEVLASVTNLDVVSSPKSSEGNFKVGGIVGKLNTSRIEVPSGGVVTTKGSTQVLRSAGVAGKGNVAAYGRGKGEGIGQSQEARGEGEGNQVGSLEVGQTGQRQVMATVKAELSKKVLIQGGGMSREIVKKVIDQHLDEITNCYEAALITNPSLMGKIIFEWKILLSGRVGEIRISFSSVKSDSIHECIKEKIKSWQFPKPQDTEVVVSYPFIFDIVGF